MTKFAKHYKSINETIIAKYPRHDGKEIVGLSSDVEWYVYIDNLPTITASQGIRKTLITLTEEPDSEYPHLKRCYQGYEVFEIVPEIDIFEKLEKLIVIASKEDKDRTVEEKQELDKIKNKPLNIQDYGITRS